MQVKAASARGLVWAGLYSSNVAQLKQQLHPMCPYSLYKKSSDCERICFEFTDKKEEGVAMVDRGFGWFNDKFLEVFVVSSLKDLMKSVTNPKELIEIENFGEDYNDLIVFD